LPFLQVVVFEFDTVGFVEFGSAMQKIGGCTIYFESGSPVSIWTTVMWARSGGVVDDDYYVKRSGQYLMGCEIVLYASGGWKETCSNL
jgi:hypothetical protein